MGTSTISELLPDFASELEDLVKVAGRGELAGQFRDLPILDRCRCGESGCAHFFTAPRPSSDYGPDHENVLLPSARGLVVLDLVLGRIVAVEVLDRPEVKAVLDAHL